MIELIDLYKSFNKNHVLRGANLTIKDGETMVIIGGSGTGKSVILKHIIGLLKPDKGKIVIDGEDLTGSNENQWDNVRRKFGMLFQGAALFDSLTVWENVGFGLLQYSNLGEKRIKEIAKEKLEMVRLKGVEDLMPSDLSGGMKKRVGLARAIAMEPQILLYDEPTTGLDPITADTINDLIVEMTNRLKITSIAITHDMVSAYKIANRIAMLYKGEIIEVGSPEEIKNTKSPIVKQFITGSSIGPITEDR